jgi:DNA repair ATPase RecN
MATPQEIQQILAEIQRQYDSLGQTNPFANFDTSNITDAEATIRQLESGLRDVRSRVQDIDRDMGGVVSAFQSTLDAIKKQNSAIGKSAKALSGLQSIAQKLLYDQQGITKLNEKQLKNLKEQAKQKYSDLQASKAALAIEIAELELQGDQSDAIIDKRLLYKL